MLKIIIVSNVSKYSSDLKTTISSWGLKINEDDIRVLLFSENIDAINKSCDLLILDYSEYRKPIYEDISEMKRNFNATGMIIIIDLYHLLESTSLFSFNKIQIHLRKDDFNKQKHFVEALQSFIKTHNQYLSILNEKGSINPDIYKPYIFKSESSFSALREALLAAKAEYNVLLMGETGVGKEIFAKIIHNNSLRSKKTFVSINTSTLYEENAESVLFGYVKGAFTDAKEDKDGFFKKADGSTLFLDEIGDMPLKTQTQLLRVLQSEGTKREFNMKGTTKITESDVRIIAASNKFTKNNKDGIRNDLFNRFTWPIEISPLRERKEEILPLIEYFIKDENIKTKRKVSMSNEAIGILLNYNHPDNIRGLKYIILRAHTRCDSNRIEITHLDPELQILD